MAQPFRRFEHVSDFLRPPSPWRSSCPSGRLSVLPRKRNARASRHDTPVPEPDKSGWSNLQRHIEGLRKSERENKLMSVECPYPRPRCPKSFDCVLELEFHLQDIHGLDMPKQSKTRKRSRVQSEEVQQAMKKRQRRDYEQEVSESHFFVHTTTEMMITRLWKGVCKLLLSFFTFT